MVIFSSRPDSIGRITEEFKFFSDPVLITSTLTAYKSWEGKKLFTGNGAYAVEAQTFGVGFIEEFVLSQKDTLSKLSSTLKKGGFLIVKIDPIPWVIESFTFNINRIKKNIEADALVAEKREALTEAYREKLFEWREQCSRIKEENLDAEEEFKEAFKAASKEEKGNMVLPEKKPLPPKPMEPMLPEYQKGASIHSENLKDSDGWKIFERFEIFKIKDSKFGILKKRESKIFFNNQNVLALKVDTIDKEQLNQMIKMCDVDDLDKVKKIRQSFFSMECFEIVSSDKTLQSIRFSEEGGVEDITLPTLAPIKPMHAASMLAGGIGSFAKEVTLQGRPTLLKGAMVKEFHKRNTIIDGKDVEEVIETWESRLGVYDITKLELKIL